MPWGVQCCKGDFRGQIPADFGRVPGDAPRDVWVRETSRQKNAKNMAAKKNVAAKLWRPIYLAAPAFLAAFFRRFSLDGFVRDRAESRDSGSIR